MGSEFAMQCRAAHTKEDTKLLTESDLALCWRPAAGLTLQLAQPGFLAPQSAHVELPGTVLINSCNARSLRACCRLLMLPDMSAIQRQKMSNVDEVDVEVVCLC